MALYLAAAITAMTTLLMTAASTAEAAGTAAADFLNVPVGGRPAAMGGAYSALATDAYAPVWNAAGLPFAPAPQLAAMHLDYLSSIDYEFVGGVLPLTKTDGLGAAVQYMHPKAVTARDETGADIGGFTSYYAAYSLAYGRAVTPSLSFGGAAKLVDARLADVSARTLAGDVGALYRAGADVTLSATASNLGGRLRFLEDRESLPDSYRLGAAYRPAASWTLAADGAYDRADGAFGRVGAEWRPIPLLAVRAGYHGDGSSDQGPVSGLTTGVGLTALGQRFDYAWEPMGRLGDTHYFSAVLSFAGTGK